MVSAQGATLEGTQPNAAGKAYNMSRLLPGQPKDSSTLVIVNGHSRTVYGPLDEHGRAIGVYGYVTPDSLGKGGEGIPQQNMRIMKFPIYGGDNPVPVKFLLVAFGEKGFNMKSVYVLNK